MIKRNYHVYQGLGGPYSQGPVSVAVGPSPLYWLTSVFTVSEDGPVVLTKHLKPPPPPRNLFDL